MPDQSTRPHALVDGSPQERAGRDRSAEERSPELLCLLLQHLEQVRTSRIGGMVRSGWAVPLTESQPTLHRKFPERDATGADTADG